MSTGVAPPSLGARERVENHVRRLIETGDLHPGDRLPAERELARALGVSRPTVRSGLKALAAMGVVRSRRGAGTFIADGPPDLILASRDAPGMPSPIRSESCRYNRNRPRIS